MLTRFDTQTILAQLFRERSELDRQIAEIESAAPQPPHFTILCMHCKRILDPANDRWRHSESHAYPPGLVSHGLCPECLRTHYADLL